MSPIDLRLRGRSSCLVLLLTTFALAWTTGTARSDDAASAPIGWASATVPGEDASGASTGAGDWIAEKCEIAVEGDVLRFVSGEGWIRYPYPLGDFVFTGEYRPLQESKWDSGIYFRSPLPPQGKTWPDRRQINLKQGEEGTLLGPKVVADQALIRPGEWRSFELTAIGNKATLEINGQPAWTTDSVTDAVGWLALLAKGLDDWTPIEKDSLDCWKLEHGVLSCLPKNGPSLRTKEPVKDFAVRLSYRLAEGGNSGVYLRTPEGGSHHGDGAGIEVQLLHDDAEKYATLKPWQYTGSLYGIVPAKRGSARGPGEWNTMQIACEGTKYQVILNGQVVTQATADDAPELAKRAVEGFLGLQHHGGGVDYRDVRLGPPTFAP